MQNCIKNKQPKTVFGLPDPNSIPPALYMHTHIVLMCCSMHQSGYNNCYVEGLDLKMNVESCIKLIHREVLFITSSQWSSSAQLLLDTQYCNSNKAIAFLIINLFFIFSDFITNKLNQCFSSEEKKIASSKVEK